jgi:hypothetical protein
MQDHVRRAAMVLEDEALLLREARGVFDSYAKRGAVDPYLDFERLLALMGTYRGGGGLLHTYISF